MRRETDTDYVHVVLSEGWTFTEAIYLDYKVDDNENRTLRMDHLLKEKARIEAESGNKWINWNDFMERNSDEIPPFTYWRRIKPLIYKSNETPPTIQRIPVRINPSRRGLSR